MGMGSESFSYILVTGDAGIVHHPEQYYSTVSLLTETCLSSPAMDSGAWHNCWTWWWGFHSLLHHGRVHTEFDPELVFGKIGFAKLAFVSTLVAVKSILRLNLKLLHPHTRTDPESNSILVEWKTTWHKTLCEHVGNNNVGCWCCSSNFSKFTVFGLCYSSIMFKKWREERTMFCLELWTFCWFFFFRTWDFNEQSHFCISPHGSRHLWKIQKQWQDTLRSPLIVYLVWMLRWYGFAWPFVHMCTGRAKSVLVWFQCPHCITNSILQNQTYENHLKNQSWQNQLWAVWTGSSNQTHFRINSKVPMWTWPMRPLCCTYDCLWKGQQKGYISLNLQWQWQH